VDPETNPGGGSGGAGHGELINERYEKYEKWMENGQNHATFTYILGFFGKSWEVDGFFRPC